MDKVLKTAFAFFVVFLYGPLLLLVAFSFNSGKYINEFSQPTIKWYAKLFANESLLNAMKNSFVVALFSSALAVSISVLFSFALYKCKGRIKNYSSRLIQVMIISPDMSLAIGLMILFEVLRFTMGLTTVVIAHTTFGIAYASSLLAARFNQMDSSIESAARDLGANELQALYLVILPNIAPAAITAFLVCFTLSWDDFIFSFFTSSAGSSTLPIQALALLKRGINPEINAVATLSMLISFTIILAGLRLQKIPNLLNPSS